MRRSVWSVAGALFTLAGLGACGSDGRTPIVIQVVGDDDAGTGKKPAAKPGRGETSNTDAGPNGRDPDVPSDPTGPADPDVPDDDPTPSGEEDPGREPSNDPEEPAPEDSTPTPGSLVDGGTTPATGPEPELVAPGPVTPVPDPGPVANPQVKVVPAIFRDFSESHPDFGFPPGNCGNGEATPGIVAPTLDAEGRPVLASNPELSCVTSAETFAEWYRDGNNVTVMGELHLYDNGIGGFVNRFGPNGEQLRVVVDGGNETSGYGTSLETCATACEQLAPFTLDCENTCRPAADQMRAAADVLAQAEAEGADAATLAELRAEVAAATAYSEACANECAAEFDALVDACAIDCKPCSFNPEQYCVGGEYTDFDGTPLFFPVDGVTGATADPGPAKLPEQYGYPGWPWEEDVFGAGPDHNFYFTTEVHHSFRYDVDTNARLDFTGDDDLWVFVNGILAIDLGGTHVPLDGSVTINADSAATFGLEPGNVYDIAVFHAERMMEGSSFRLTLTGFDAE